MRGEIIALQNVIRRGVLHQLSDHLGHFNLSASALKYRKLSAMASKAAKVFGINKKSNLPRTSVKLDESFSDETATP